MNRDFYSDLAEKLKQSGKEYFLNNQLSDALEYFYKVIALRVDNSCDYNDSGAALGSSGRLIDASVFFRRAYLLRPFDALSSSNYGVTLLQLGIFDRAQATLYRALILDPSSIQATTGLGMAASKGRKASSALQFFLRSFRLDPDSPDGDSNLAGGLNEVRRFDEALLHSGRALTYRPSNREACNNRALTLRALSNVEEGGSWALRAVVVDRRFSRATNTRALLLADMARFSDALACYNEVLCLDPSDGEVRANKALLELYVGSYQQGWRDFEFRWATAANSAWVESVKALRESPEYSQPASLTRRVLVWAEQGVGDEVMFGGLLEEFRGLCGEMVLQVDRRLMGLFGRSLPGVKVYERGQEVPESDYDEQIPMGSLGKWLRPTRESFEGKGGRYLRAQEGLGKRLREELGVLAGQRLVGLSWRSASVDTGAARSLKLKELVGALAGVPGVRFLNLQYGDVREEIEELSRESGVEVLSHPEIDNREDLEGLAGLIEGCDLVVSVGNATAHLSGALGQRTWVLLPYVAGWRWLHEGERCPWYQSVRLYRQAQRDRWDAVLEKLGQNIK
jgi:tetratricopeptide (TPR) repeat protein